MTGSPVNVRVGTPDDDLAVVRLVDAAMLDVSLDAVRCALETGDALVAEVDGTAVGTLVLDGCHIEAVAVRKSRRGRGVGTALVEAADERCDRLTADFDDRVRPFYESLGFDVERRGGRLWGVR